MPDQFFFAKQVGTGTTEDPIRPTGVDDLEAAGIAWDSVSIVRGTWHLVKVIDATVSQLNAYAALADTRELPRNLNSTINNQGQLDQTIAVLDELQFPSQWPTIGMTYLEVLRVCWTLYALYSRLQHYYGPLAMWNYLIPANLDLAWNQHPLQVRQALRSAADSLEMDYSTVNGTDPLKVALWKTAQTWDSTPWGL